VQTPCRSFDVIVPLSSLGHDRAILARSGVCGIVGSNLAGSPGDEENETV
jgi:hypothetical protein